MSDPIPADPSAPSTTVSFTMDDAVLIAKSLGALTVAVIPGEAALVALITGAAELLTKTIMPAIQNAHDRTISVAQQATLAAESAAERARVGAPPAVGN